MIKIYLIVGLQMLLLISCHNSKPDDELNYSLDTIYGGDFNNNIVSKDKRLSIVIENGDSIGQPIFLKLGEPSLVRISIPRLSNYEIYPSEIIGADIIKVDTSNNYFLIIARDSIIAFNINQYYKKGRVVLYNKTYQKNTNQFVEQSIPLTGFKLVGNVKWEIQTSSKAINYRRD